MEYVSLLFFLTTAWLYARSNVESAAHEKDRRTLLALFLCYPMTVIMLHLGEQDRLAWHWAILGWTYACVYIAFCELAWRLYHHRSIALALKAPQGSRWINYFLLFTLLVPTPYICFVLYAIFSDA